MRKKRTAERPLFYRVFYLMRTMIDSTAPPTEAVTVVMPVLMGEIVPSAEMDRTDAATTWAVADASVLSISADGLITPAKVGTTTVTATVGGAVLSITVRIK